MRRLNWVLSVLRPGQLVLWQELVHICMRSASVEKMAVLGTGVRTVRPLGLPLAPTQLWPLICHLV